MVKLTYTSAYTEQIASKMHSKWIEMGEEKTVVISTVTTEKRKIEYFFCSEDYRYFEWREHSNA